MGKKLRKNCCTFLSMLMILTTVFTSMPTISSAEPYPKATADLLFIKKVIKGTDTYLKDAELTLYKGEGKTDVLKTWTTKSNTKEEIKLSDLENNTTYVLSETKSPEGYKVANDIMFKKDDAGIISVKQGDTWKEVTEFEEKDQYATEAYMDAESSINSWDGQSYSKVYYLKDGKGADNEVIYCLNLDLSEPPFGYDNGEIIDSTIKGDMGYTKSYSPEKLVEKAITPRISEPQRFFNIINKILYAGYPNNGINLQNGITDGAFRTITQLAIYYYTDSFDISEHLDHGHDFEGIVKPEQKDIYDAYKKLLEYAEDDSKSIPDTDAFKTNIYIPKFAGYQNIIGTKFSKDGLGYVITMEDEDKASAPVVPDMPEPTIKTTVEANGQKASADRPVIITNSQAQEGVDVVDYIAYTDLIKGEKYTIKGTIKKVDEKGTILDENVATVEKELEATDTNGTFALDFGKVIGLESGGRYVVYEQAISVEKLVDTDGDGIKDLQQGLDKVTNKPNLVHENPTDKAQTIVVKKDDSKISTRVEVTKEDGTVLSTGSDSNPAKVPATEADNKLTVNDYVDYTNFEKDQEYKIKGTLYRISEDNVLEEVATTDVTLTVADVNGTAKLSFYDNILKKGGRYVVFEEAESTSPVLDNDNDGIKETVEKAEHKDQHDQNQTIDVEGGKVENPNDVGGLKTTVSVGDKKATDTKPVVLSADEIQKPVTVTDTVEYRLVKDVSYTITGQLMEIDKEGNATPVAGAEKTADVVGTGEVATVDIVFENITLKDGVKYVVFETAIPKLDPTFDYNIDGERETVPQVIKHEDKDDLAQTIIVKEKIVAEPEKPSGDTTGGDSGSSGGSSSGSDSSTPASKSEDTTSKEETIKKETSKEETIKKETSKEEPKKSENKIVTATEIKEDKNGDVEKEPKSIEQEELKKQTDVEEVENADKKESYKTTENSAIDGKIQISDDDMVYIAVKPENGTITIDKDGSWHYVPKAGFVGRDRFVVTVKKSDGSTEDVVVELDVEETPLGATFADDAENSLPKTGTDYKIAILGFVLVVSGMRKLYKK